MCRYTPIRGEKGGGELSGAQYQGGPIKASNNHVQTKYKQSMSHLFWVCNVKSGLRVAGHMT